MPSTSTRWIAAIAVATVVAGAGMIVASSVIHLHLWLAGYRNIARIGPLFLAQAIVGILLAAAMLATRWVGLVGAGALYLAATIGGLVISATVGFLGFHDGFNAAWAGWSIGVQTAGIVLLIAAIALDRLSPSISSQRVRS